MFFILFRNSSSSAGRAKSGSEASVSLEIAEADADAAVDDEAAVVGEGRCETSARAAAGSCATYISFQARDRGSCKVIAEDVHTRGERSGRRGGARVALIGEGDGGASNRVPVRS